MRSRRGFLGVMAIVFVASAATTIASCTSMSAMGVMEMPGGWTMSHMWMLMPEQTWSGDTVSFVGRWVVMMVAMMLPSLTPTLWCHHQSIGGTGRARTAGLTALVGVGYFAVWAVIGAAVFPLGVVLARAAMRQPTLSRAVPLVVGATVLVAGVLQHTQWKARHLAFCRAMPDDCLTPSAGPGTALQRGWRLGLHCSQSCAGLAAVALALGIMDLRVMTAVAALITAERLTPNSERVARAIGAIGSVAGVLVIAAAIPTYLEWGTFR